MIITPDRLEALLKKRQNEIEKFLMKDHIEVFAEQKHLDRGSVERAYWHYGYLAAMRDIINRMEGAL